MIQTLIPRVSRLMLAGEEVRSKLLAPGGSSEPRDLVMGLVPHALQEVGGGYAPGFDALLADFGPVARA